MDLEKSLYTIIECTLRLIPPNPCSLFAGYLTPTQQALFKSIPSETLSPPPSSPSHPVSSSPPSGSKPVPLLRAFQRAIHRQDGPLFLLTMDRINALLRRLKYPP
ncbi:hypothetical protein C0992_007110, partial [Termitomyces sp. T32_za158]